MMHMPDDNNYSRLLADYLAPAGDDGFADTLMAEIDAQNVQAAAAKLARLRRIALYGAGFVGGIIAAVQLPKLAAMFQGVEASIPALPVDGINTSSLAFDPALIMAAIFVGLVLWAALDQRATELF